MHHEALALMVQKQCEAGATSRSSHEAMRDTIIGTIIGNGPQNPILIIKAPILFGKPLGFFFLPQSSVQDSGVEARVFFFVSLMPREFARQVRLQAFGSWIAGIQVPSFLLNPIVEDGQRPELKKVIAVFNGLNSDLGLKPP